MVLNSEWGFLNTGEECQVFLEKPQDDSNPAETPEMELDSGVEQELERSYPDFYDVTSLPLQDGKPRVLVRKSSKAAHQFDREIRLSALQPAGLSDQALLVAAAQTCLNTISECNRSDGKRCHDGDHWWYRRSNGQWCRRPDTCTHAY